MFEADAFWECVEWRLRGETRHGTLAYIEIQDPYIVGSSDRRGIANPSTATHDQICYLISEAMGQDEVFCWQDGRFILLFSDATTAPQALSLIGHRIAEKSARSAEGAPVHLTPAIGFVDLRMATSAQELWQMAETALSCAKSSLEIEPFRYVKNLNGPPAKNLSARFTRLWAKVPRGIALSIQLILSLILGLGVPFVFYAACDALGADISGPVYIGVVAVLVITATSIYIEGLLALKPTTPPKEIGAPYPTASVIIPAYLPNEADTIIETLNAFLRLDYPGLVQIIIAYNTPKPMAIEEKLEAIAASGAFAGRFIIEPVRVTGSTSKAQNVNAVVGRVRGEFVGIFDADHHPRPDSLRRAWRWLSNGWDIVQGRCAIRNGSDSWVSRMAAIEFQQIYAVAHPGRARFHGFGIFGGSNGFWRTEVLHQTRMRHSMLTEDIDSSIRAVESGYRIAGDRDLVSEELAPTSLNLLLNQRLRWAQGWFQVSFKRLIPALVSPHLSARQRFGIIHLLLWRELFPWYSIQVVPILIYWIWAYGWDYINWAIPIFVATTIYTFATGPAQVLLAYVLAERPLQRKVGWFLEYLLVSTFFFTPFKDTLSRIAHLKEAMGERAWRITPRSSPSRISTPPRTGHHQMANQLAKGALAALVVVLMSSGSGLA